MSVATIGIDDYPLSLSNWRGGEESLWVMGNYGLLQMPLASVVGKREVSAEGVARTKKITSILVREGFCVVSGLAQGVDTVAHTQALRLGGMTIAVMGTPIDECYPKDNFDLKQEIARNGLVISQFAPGSSVQRGNFPRRNILMAALSSITIVVEADIDSGTRHQVKAAIEMGRQVGFMASLVERNFPWVLDALKSGYGTVIENPEDAVAILRKLKPRESAEITAAEPMLFDAAEITLPKVTALQQDKSKLGDTQPPVEVAQHATVPLEFNFQSEAKVPAASDSKPKSEITPAPVADISSHPVVQSKPLSRWKRLLKFIQKMFNW